ncbi:alpha/beta fold hydrolase [Glycomyces tenuis]|uniref:alpha/beta fold hydrolase n=1 Tax=Glycomyces tenuis TaxID=58116 RepID=UPI0004201DDC|nr:alpha/beta fold hydrolase [Glycomyces tenuis]
MTDAKRHALVFGSSGQIGRHLVLELLRAGARTSVATRTPASYERLRAWLAAHGAPEAPTDVRVDFEAADLLPGGPAAYTDITEIHNCAGAYRFGMSVEEARRANVGSAEAVVAFAARLPRLERLVQVSGYRVGGQDPAAVPWSEHRIEQAYREGPYEASRKEADAVVQARARELGVPWSIVNPATVIGDSRTGEAEQQLGLATTLEHLWRGGLPALPGGPTTFVPVIPVDYVARFMAMLPTDPSTVDTSYWLLDEHTPPLPELLGRVGAHYRVGVPRTRVPAQVLKRLPRRLTKADPETLTFLSDDRYPTDAANALAERHGLEKPDTMDSILAWADHLAAHRFGAAPEPGRRFTRVGGARTFELGDAEAQRVILPGLPVNADSWARVVELLPETRAVDLPGTGMSPGTGRSGWDRWTAALLADGGEGVHLIGQSIGAAVALEAAAAHPDRRPSLTLVSPFFLQPRRAAPRPLIRWQLRRADAADLAELLTGDRSQGPALESVVSDLRRPGVAERVAGLASAASDRKWRQRLRALLQRHRGPVHLVVGANDPLAPDARPLVDALANVRTTVIPGAGHHPQLTHPDRLAAAIASTPPPERR